MTLLQNLAKGSGQKHKQKPWFQRIQCNQKNWRKNRPFLLNILLKIQDLNESCCVCGEQKAIIPCSDCCNSPICQRCDYDVHSMHPLHGRKSYQNGSATSSPPTELLDTNLETELFDKMFLNFQILVFL